MVPTGLEFRPQAPNFPVYSLLNSEFAPETGSHQTRCTAIHSRLFGVPLRQFDDRFADDADIENGASHHQCVAGFTEAALEIRKAITPDEIARAVTIDEALVGSNDRADYITSIAENGGLSVAALRGEVQAFCCLDHGYFFGKPFISLLIVSPDARRLGLGAGLLSHSASAYPEVWTSTNQSNSAMRKLLDKAGWRYCGELSGLDEGDPERFYRTA